MKAVTVLGVSRTLEDQLKILVGSFRNETGDQSWHVHMQRLPTSHYYTRVDAPDRYSEAHEVTITPNTARDVREILVNAAKSWKVRVQVRAARDTAIA